MSVLQPFEAQPTERILCAKEKNLITNIGQSEIDKKRTVVVYRLMIRPGLRIL